VLWSLELRSEKLAGHDLNVHFLVTGPGSFLLDDLPDKARRHRRFTETFRPCPSLEL